ncbi:MAG: hypothetical protein PUB96_06210 [Helicobacteraceae bacterium]|nr:hypothetical protein [Helicobacteraceae bacterium]
MIFTLPKMQKWLANKWTNCLNFEHTIFLSEKVIDFLLKASGFEVLEKKYFKEHSIFYATKKENKSAEKCIVDCHDLLRKSRNDDVLNVESLKQDYEKNKNLFLEMQEYYKEMIVKINKILMETSREVYLFGAHLFSQHLLYNGLDSKKVVGILDNNANKQGKRLYGTNLQVSSPRILSDKNALVILCAGAYNEEIKKDILENINRKVEVICF